MGGSCRQWARSSSDGVYQLYISCVPVPRIHLYLCSLLFSAFFLFRLFVLISYIFVWPIFSIFLIIKRSGKINIKKDKSQIFNLCIAFFFKVEIYLFPLVLEVFPRRWRLVLLYWPQFYPSLSYNLGFDELVWPSQFLSYLTTSRN